MQAASQRPAGKFAFELFVAVAVIGLVCALGPWWAVYEFNPDEGFNLQKAVLVSQGHALYSEIWSDQPPLLTYWLAVVHDLFPFSVVAARATVLLFAAVLAVSLFRVVARFEGLFAAAVSVILLASSSLFLELGVSVMIGLPAVTLALVAIDVATSGTPRSRAFHAAAAGGVFALALLTKMFVFIMVPAVLVALWFGVPRQVSNSMRATALSLVLFLIFAASVMAVVLAMLGLSAEQLVGTHLAARQSDEFAGIGGFRDLFSLLRHGALIPHWFVVLFGLAAFWVRPRSPLLIPMLWLVSGVAVLGFHRPLWNHQALILVPPLCWLGAAGFKSLFVPGERLGFAEMLLEKSGPRMRMSALAGVMVLIGVIAAHAVREVRHVRELFSSGPSIAEAAAQTRLALYDRGAGSLIVDHPIDAYYLHRGVPANLAVWSAKRVAIGQMPEAEVLEDIKAHPGSPVLLRRHSFTQGFLNRVADHVPAVAVSTQRYGGPDIHFFAPAGPASDLETRLLAQLPAVVAGSMGGVAGPNAGERLARPQSMNVLPDRSVVARPPGSAQELGACLVAASRIAQSRRLFLEAAGVGNALACVQTRNGGWAEHASTMAGCTGNVGHASADEVETLDDGTMPSILYFSFDLADRFGELSLDKPAWLTGMIERALSFSVQSQLADGSWPQTIGGNRYHKLATLNDDTMTGMIRVLLVGYQRYHDPAYLAAARRGGDFLLRAQHKAGQTGFAQQYAESLEIEPARKFEPPAFSSLETGYAINALIDLHLVTGDKRFLVAAEAAADWLRSSQIAPETWARLYEVGINRPVYADRSGAVTYRLEDLSVSEQRSYRWIGGREVFPEIGVALDRMDKLRLGTKNLRDHDATVAAASLLAATPTARLPLTAAGGMAVADDLGSTRGFAVYCAGLVASAMQADAAVQDGTDP
ncbi:PelA/Pel-15E family pectate lyase [Hoeflea marina]|uniref:PelA/Pel-15E family pectate lyase n=1 Tax=Hoeflea marina TaxID=274592 RepID=A0A317PGU1_9HYPH|nr:pectate lyase [Hoeflea marina]PWV97125.1 PelA/Pel-15E family pectate lyase [Hoeflea marina]